jgi:hypothetical protein
MMNGKVKDPEFDTLTGLTFKKFNI